MGSVHVTRVMYTLPDFYTSPVTYIHEFTKYLPTNITFENSTRYLSIRIINLEFNHTF